MNILGESSRRHQRVDIVVMFSAVAEAEALNRSIRQRNGIYSFRCRPLFSKMFKDQNI